MNIDIQDGAVAIIFNPDESCEFLRVGESAINWNNANAKFGAIVAAYIKDDEGARAIMEWFKKDYAKVMSDVASRMDLN